MLQKTGNLIISVAMTWSIVVMLQAPAAFPTYKKAWYPI